jgi:ABC-2 type transport system ATP-binding protein
MAPVLSIQGLNKTYASGLSALSDIHLDIEEGEIFALLGPNGAGKSTLINTVCGVVTPTSGKITVAGHDIAADYRVTRGLIGLVPQEIHVDMFETVGDVVSFSRGLFGLPPNPAWIRQVLADLSLSDKIKAKVRELSGGMKRRVLIAKALAHEPAVLFLDEPTAGVDVELRRDMWGLVRRMRERGVTIILTTHYIEEAEEMADRVGVILKGRLILVEEKTELMKKLGRKRLTLQLHDRMDAVPQALAEWNLALSPDGHELSYEFDAHTGSAGVPALLKRMGETGVAFRDLNTQTSSLEDIFVNLVQGQA